MTFSLPRKRRTTRPARSTPSRTACRLLAAAAWLALAGGAAAQAPAGQPRSTFVPRTDAARPGPSLVLPVQAKGGTGQPSTTPGTTPGTAPPTTPGTTQPGTTQPGKIPGTTPGTTPGKDTPPGTIPGTPGTPIPGFPGAAPGIAPGTGAGLDVGGTGAGPRAGTDPYEAYIRLDPPGKERLFGSRDTERELEERMRQERRDTGLADPVVFPEKPELTTETYQTRRFAPTVVLAEPNYVVYRRLYFEDKNSERYGWDLGPIQPLVSTLCFFKDVALWPHNFASYPCRRFDTSAGQCLPGDPVPYICYPPEFTTAGLLAEAGVIGLLFYAVP